MKAGKSLVELAQELQSRAARKSDYVADTRAVTMDEKGAGLVIASADPIALSVDTHTHRQIGTHLGIPSKYYDRMLAEQPALLAQNVNTWFHEDPSRRMIRALDGKARAFLSDRYRRIDNEEVAEAVLPVLLESAQDIRIESCEVTDRKLYLKAVFPRIEGEVAKGDVVQSGIVISNSEIGAGSLSVQPMVFRLICTNGMIAADSGMRRYHVGQKVGDGMDVEALLRDETKRLSDQALLAALQDVVRASLAQVQFDALLKRMREATDGPRIERPVEAVEQLGKSFVIPQVERQSILENLIRGGDYSRWGMLNAVTAVANDHESYDRATELEAMGGQILDLAANDWTVIAQAA